MTDAQIKAQALAEAIKSQRQAKHASFMAREALNILLHCQPLTRFERRRYESDARVDQMESAAWHHDAALDVAFAAGMADSYEAMLAAAGV